MLYFIFYPGKLIDHVVFRLFSVKNPNIFKLTLISALSVTKCPNVTTLCNHGNVNNKVLNMKLLGFNPVDFTMSNITIDGLRQVIRNSPCLHAITAIQCLNL